MGVEIHIIGRGVFSEFALQTAEVTPYTAQQLDWALDHLDGDEAKVLLACRLAQAYGLSLGLVVSRLRSNDAFS